VIAASSRSAAASNRAHNKRRCFSDLRESGSIEQDAGPGADDLYPPTSTTTRKSGDRGITEVIVTPANLAKRACKGTREIAVRVPQFTYSRFRNLVRRLKPGGTPARTNQLDPFASLPMISAVSGGAGGL